jgi:transcriptional regulator with XRE-family HTH domain
MKDEYLFGGQMQNQVAGTKLREFRKLAGISLLKAASCAGVSYARMQQAEAGFAKLTNDQQEFLKKFYLALVHERLKGIEALSD